MGDAWHAQYCPDKVLVVLACMLGTHHHLSAPKQPFMQHGVYMSHNYLSLSEMDVDRVCDMLVEF